MESPALLQGMHLRMCGEVLPLRGSDTYDHIRTSPKSYVQRRSLQQSLNPPLDCQGNGSSKMESPALLQGMHLRMCGEVLPLRRSDTYDHIRTSPMSYVQRRLQQQSPDAPLDHQGSGSSCYSLSLRSLIYSSTFWIGLTPGKALG
jgi:hypothetical protein